MIARPDAHEDSAATSTTPDPIRDTGVPGREYRVLSQAAEEGMPVPGGAVTRSAAGASGNSYSAWCYSMPAVFLPVEEKEVVSDRPDDGTQAHECGHGNLQSWPHGHGQAIIMIMIRVGSHVALLL
eukprot:187694-Rhodomonas_salina.1